MLADVVELHSAQEAAGLDWREALLKRARAAIKVTVRIASPEMFLNAELLPHVNCSPMARERRGSDLSMATRKELKSALARR
ncbi:hypothetical protein GA0061098_10685 [Bradyrhizobium shewense]|uniref:Uncharacterized protein n=1 Tax=Bradyrhizobium shewense TaxID=1761772 RepID=A0A1C3XUW7_9BRAD|nr:hypothetical protein GA0061098_10685 [Bradyrhizobium shewense]